MVCVRVGFDARCLFVNSFLRNEICVTTASQQFQLQGYSLQEKNMIYFKTRSWHTMMQRYSKLCNYFTKKSFQAKLGNVARAW